MTPDPKRVFVVYGRNVKAYRSVLTFLQTLGLQPITFVEAKNAVESGSPFVGEIVRKGMDIAQAVIVVFTPDEYASLRPGLRLQTDGVAEVEHWQARQNVTLEAGMALAINEKRTILLVFGDVALPSDLSGRYYFRASNDPEMRNQLAKALRIAGCDITHDPYGLYSADISGDFVSCLEMPGRNPITSWEPFQEERGQHYQPKESLAPKQVALWTKYKAYILAPVFLLIGIGISWKYFRSAQQMNMTNQSPVAQRSPATLGLSPTPSSSSKPNPKETTLRFLVLRRDKAYAGAEVTIAGSNDSDQETQFTTTDGWVTFRKVTCGKAVTVKYRYREGKEGVKKYAVDCSSANYLKSEYIVNESF